MTHVAPNWLGEFQGNGLSFNDCEVLTIQNIPSTLYRNEAELMQVKWFDYRRLHPMMATYYFMKCYKDAYQDFFKIAVDAEQGQYASPIKEVEYAQKIASTGKNKGKLIDETISWKDEEGVRHTKKVVARTDVQWYEGREKLAIWKLRQLVDKLGIRYDFFFTRVTKWYVEEVFRREALFPPRPGHILTNEDFLSDVMMDWEEELGIRLQVPADTHYRIANWTGSVNQLAFEQFVIGQINIRQYKEFSLSTFIYTHDLLRIEEAVRQYGNLVSNAIAEITFP